MASFRMAGRQTKASRAEHPLVVEAREHLVNAKEGRGGYLRPTKRLMCDVIASHKGVLPLLKLASRLYRALEARGHRVALAPHDGERRLHRPEAPRSVDRFSTTSFWWPQRPTISAFGDVLLGLTVWEVAAPTETQFYDWRWVRLTDIPKSLRRAGGETGRVHLQDLPCGRLTIRAYSPHPGVSWKHEWEEAAPGQLVDKVDDIVAFLEEQAVVVAAACVAADEKAEADRRRWEAERVEAERRHEIAEREVARKASRTELLNILEAWSTNRRISDFLHEAARLAEDLPDADRAAVLERIQEATQHLGGADALSLLRAWKTPNERFDADHRRSSRQGRW